MLTIRLSRVGKKKTPVYRIVVMPKKRDPWANNIEILGHYDPRKTPKEIVVKADRVKYWISQGAQPSDTVWNLLIEHKVIEGKKRTATHLTKKRVEKIAEKKKSDENATAAKAVKMAEVSAEASAPTETQPAEPAEAVDKEPSQPTQEPATE